jgi:BirA family biotin operon repressor/biotin-[acetyl-CoA-carboxylase] ligase
MMLRPTVLHFDSLPSTNTEAARQAASGAAEGLCVVAREQTEGRGRLGRVWASPPDAGLYCSILLRPRLAPDVWPLLTLAAALAVHDALREVGAPAVDIKWPNDIYARGRKLCGILSEAVETGAGRACVVGIGINLDARAFPPEIGGAAVSIAELMDEPPARETLLSHLLKAVAVRYARLQATDGARETLTEWCAHSSYAAGRRVSVSLGTESFEGTTRGLEPDGALRVETGAGEIRIVRAGDVTALRSAGDGPRAGQ